MVAELFRTVSVVELTLVDCCHGLDADLYVVHQKRKFCLHRLYALFERKQWKESRPKTCAGTRNKHQSTATRNTSTKASPRGDTVRSSACQKECKPSIVHALTIGYMQLCITEIKKQAFNSHTISSSRTQTGLFSIPTLISRKKYGKKLALYQDRTPYQTRISMII